MTSGVIPFFEVEKDQKSRSGSESGSESESFEKKSAKGKVFRDLKKPAFEESRIQE